MNRFAAYFGKSVEWLREKKITFRQLVPNYEIPGREEEVAEWIEADEERRQWSDDEKASMIGGFTMVETEMQVGTMGDVAGKIVVPKTLTSQELFNFLEKKGHFKPAPVGQRDEEEIHLTSTNTPKRK